MIQCKYMYIDTVAVHCGNSPANTWSRLSGQFSDYKDSRLKSAHSNSGSAWTHFHKLAVSEIQINKRLILSLEN